VAALALAAALGSWLLTGLVFTHFSTNNDEPVYVFQARMLLDHRLTLPVTPDTPWFRPWMSGEVDGRLAMVFPPVLPALLAAGEAVLGSMRLVLAALAGTAVVLIAALARTVTGDRRAGVIAAGLLATCPLFVVQSGLFLSYVLALDLELAAALLLASGAARRRRGWFVAAGGALGLLAFARPLDAALVGVPLAVAGLVVGTRRRGEVARRASAVVLGALPFVATSLAYNARVSGDPFRLPLAAIGGDNHFGFGVRRIAAGTPPVRYSLSRAVVATARNLEALPGWLPGGALLVAAAAFGLYRLRRQPWAWTMAAFVVTVPLGYLCYWGNLLVVNGQRSIGPHYYLSLLIPLVVLGSAALAAVTRRWRASMAIAGACLLVTSGTTLERAIDLNVHQVALHRREREVVDRAGLHRALVFLPSEPPDGPWLGHPRPSFINDPDLDGDVLFALDLTGRNFELLDRHRDRSVYRQLSRVAVGDPTRRAVPVLWPVRPTSAPAFRVDAHIVNVDGQAVVAAYLIDGTHRYRAELDRASAAGRAYDVSWLVGPGSVQLASGGAVTVERLPGPIRLRGDPSPPPGTVLTVGVDLGPAPDGDPTLRTEQRFWFRSRTDGCDLVLPGEQWHFEHQPKPLWLAQDDPAHLVIDVRPA
jgi:4-amino-4-deoxy-L-arabinose transferase-like glycosyltransferase